MNGSCISYKQHASHVIYLNIEKGTALLSEWVVYYLVLVPNIYLYIHLFNKL